MSGGRPNSCCSPRCSAALQGRPGDYRTKQDACRTWAAPVPGLRYYQQLSCSGAEFLKLEGRNTMRLHLHYPHAPERMRWAISRSLTETGVLLAWLVLILLVAMLVVVPAR